MTEVQSAEVQKILEETWMRIHSADEAFDMIEDIINDACSNARRSVE